MVHHPLNSLEQQVLARPSPTIDLTTLQATVSILRADVDSILKIRGTKQEIAPIKLPEDIVHDVLFIC